jgi:hypothetical protein
MGQRSSGPNKVVKKTTGQMLALDVRKLNREGALHPGGSSVLQWFKNDVSVAAVEVDADSDHLVIRYAEIEGDEPRRYEYAVKLERTPCHLGGQRVWLRCPEKGCGRRVAILYGGPNFACRHCHHLAYQSQREQPMGWPDTRALRARGRLEFDFFGEPRRPKGMRQRTFERLAKMAEEWWPL